jgi:hypothetical protein
MSLSEQARISFMKKRLRLPLNQLLAVFYYGMEVDRLRSSLKSLKKIFPQYANKDPMQAMYAYLASLGISPFSPECTSVNLIAALGQFCSSEINDFDQLPRWKREQVIYELADQIILNAVSSMTANPSQVYRLGVPALPGESASVGWPLAKRIAYLASCLYFFQPMARAVEAYSEKINESSVPASALEAVSFVQKRFNDDPEFYSEIIVENKELMKPENQNKDIFWYHSLALTSLSQTEKGRSLKPGKLKDLVVFSVLDSVILKSALNRLKKKRLRKDFKKLDEGLALSAQKVLSIFKRTISAGKEVPFCKVIDLLLQNLQRDDLKKIVNSQTEILDIDAQVGAHPFLRKLTSQIIANNLTREKTQRVLIEAAGHLKKYLSPRARSMSVQQVNKAVSALVYILIARLSLVCLDHPETALQVGLEVTNAHSGEIISG